MWLLLRWCALFAIAFFAGCGGGGGDSADPPAPPPPVVYTVQISSDAGESAARIPQAATASMTWQYSSTAANPVSTNYAVSSSIEAVEITPASGSALPNTNVNIELSYECTTIEVVEAQITITVATGSATATWRINCTGQVITIEPLEPSVASYGHDAVTEVIWRYVSEGEDPQELPYTVSSSVEVLTISPASGEALPTTSIAIELSYTCAVAGEVAHELTIAVGSASQTTSWAIFCSEETISIEQEPEAFTLSVGERAETTFAWHFESTWTEPRSLDFSLAASEQNVEIEMATGTVLADSRVEHDLAFECVTAADFEIVITIEVGSATHESTWRIECSSEVIAIDVLPQASFISIGESVSLELVWQFATTGSRTSFDYTTMVTGAAIDVMGGQGTAQPNEPVSVGFMYACVRPGELRIDIAITVGSALANAIWQIECSRETVTVEPIPGDTFVSLGDVAALDLTWTLTTTGSRSSFDYEISVDETDVQLTNSLGVVTPGSAITVRLEHVCEEIGSQFIDIKIAIGSARQSAGWLFTCTRETVAIQEPPAQASVSIGSSAAMDFRWLVRTTGKQDREFAFSISSPTLDLKIEAPNGHVMPGNGVTTSLTYLCSKQEQRSIEITISSGSAEEVLAWPVECTQEQIEFVTLPDSTVVSKGAVATAPFRWQVQTTATQSREFMFSVSSSNANLQVDPPEGLVAASMTLTTTLTYACRVAEVVQATVLIEAGNARREISWRVQCKEQTLQIVSRPVSQQIRLGSTASSELLWSFSSTLAGERVPYRVHTSNARVQLDNAEGTVLAGETVVTSMSYACRTIQTVVVDLQVEAGEVSSQATWEVTCKDEAIVIVSQPSRVVVPVGDSAFGELIWEFRSSISNELADFEVSTTTSGVQLQNSEGTALNGEPITTALRYRCNARRSVDVGLQIEAAGLSRVVSWRIDCAGEDLTSFTATLFQGPEIATIDFTADQGEWHATVRPQIETSSPDPMRFLLGRQLYVQLHAEHDERVPLPMQVRFRSTRLNAAANPVGEVQTQQLNGGEKRFASTFLFNVDADDLVAFGELQISIDPNALYVELDETNNELAYSLDGQNSLNVRPFIFTLVPIRSRDGVPDLSNHERISDPIYEYLPVHSFRPRIGNELDLRNQTWSADTGVFFLDQLYEAFLSRGGAASIFHGVVMPEPDFESGLCGIAFVNSYVSIAVDPDVACSPDVVAHEVGHNFDLDHAPACGAEQTIFDFAYPYFDGSIGVETGWLMRQEVFIDGAAPPIYEQLEHRYYDVMSYCPDTFTSQYSYGKALANIVERFGVRASLSDRNNAPAAFERVRDQSVVVTGSKSSAKGWEVRKAFIVQMEPYRFYPKADEFRLRVEHVPSGTLLHEEGIHVLIAHGKVEQASWGVRIPFFDVGGIQFEIVDKSGQQLLVYDFDASAKDR